MNDNKQVNLEELGEYEVLKLYHKKIKNARQLQQMLDVEREDLQKCEFRLEQISKESEEKCPEPDIEEPGI